MRPGDLVCSNWRSGLLQVFDTSDCGYLFATQEPVVLVCVPGYVRSSVHGASDARTQARLCLVLVGDKLCNAFVQDVRCA